MFHLSIIHFLFNQSYPLPTPSFSGFSGAAPNATPSSALTAQNSSKSSKTREATEEEEETPPPIATRPEKTKSIYTKPIGKFTLFYVRKRCGEFFSVLTWIQFSMEDKSASIPTGCKNRAPPLAVLFPAGVCHYVNKAEC